MSTAKKKKHELAVFLEFAQAAGLGIDPAVVETPDEPQPDILCRLADGPVYFELGRLLDQTLPPAASPWSCCSTTTSTRSDLLLAGFPVMPAELNARHVWEPLAARPGIFRCVWVFERYRKALLWSSPPRADEFQTRQGGPLRFDSHAAGASRMMPDASGCAAPLWRASLLGPRVRQVPRDRHVRGRRHLVETAPLLRYSSQVGRSLTPISFNGACP